MGSPLILLMAVIGQAERIPDERTAGLFVHPGNAVLRRAVSENVVSFPSQIPVLSKQSRPDVQCRAVMLYFVRGWTMSRIGARYGLPDFRVSQILNEWAVRAFALGFIQVIDSERFEAFAERPSRALLKMPFSEIAATPIPERPSAAFSPVAAAQFAAPRHAVLEALDRAIECCGEGRGEFWFHSAAAFRSFRAAVQAIKDREFESLAEKVETSLISAPGFAATEAAGLTRRRGVA